MYNASWLNKVKRRFVACVHNLYVYKQLQRDYSPIFHHRLGKQMMQKTASSKIIVPLSITAGVGNKAATHNLKSPRKSKELSNTALASLTSSLVSAIELRDVEKFLKLGQRIPMVSTQRKHIEAAIETVQPTLSFSIKLDQVTDEILSRLQHEFTSTDFDRLITILNASSILGIQIWTKFDVLDTVITENYSYILEASWRNYIALLMSQDTNPSRTVGGLFFNNVLKNDFSKEGVAAVAHLLLQHSDYHRTIGDNWRDSLAYAFDKSLRSYLDSTSITESDMIQIGTLCSVLLELKVESLTFLATMRLFTTLDQNMSTFNYNTSIPSHLEKCIELAAVSMTGKVFYRDGKEFEHTMNSLMNKACSAANSSRTVCNLFTAMVSGSHVSVAAVKKFDLHVKKMDWCKELLTDRAVDI